MVGRDVEFAVHKEPAKPGKPILEVKGLTVASKLHHNNAVKQVSFNVREGEIVCIAGIDGNGQTELVYGLTGLEPVREGTGHAVRSGYHEYADPQAFHPRHEPHPGGSS